MLIHIDKHYLRQKTGKSKFAVRLSKALQELGVKITNDPNKKADIGLNIGRCHYPNKAKKQVLRVGPAAINTNMNWKKINHEKAHSVKKADAIIYQSRYSKKIYHKLVCHPDKPEIIIFNGADHNPEVAEAISFVGKTKHFIASTRVWLSQKRLKQIIKAFWEADIPKSHLIICGDTLGVNKKYGNHNDVSFLGNTHQRFLERLYRECIAMIHLTYVDACPNSVIEAQVAGCPVICTDQGGTKEIFRYGKVLTDKPFKYKPVNLDKPPKIDREMLIQAMNEATTWNFDKNLAADLHIDNIARQYLKFFEELL